MPKLPNNGATTAPKVEPRNATEEHNLDKLITEDRKRFSSFVKNLNGGIKFDDMSDELKVWWANRY